MLIFAAFILGVVLGCIVMLFVLPPRQRKAQAMLKQAEEIRTSVIHREVELSEQVRVHQIQHQEFLADRKAFDAAKEMFDQRAIKYEEYAFENQVLKRDLQNIDAHLHKVMMDTELQKEKQDILDQRSNDIAKRYLADTVKAVSAAISDRNYASCKSRLVDAIERVRDIGFVVTADDEAKLVKDLQSRYELAVRAAFEREEQARIKADVREQERNRREVEREKERIERERREEERRKAEIERDLARVLAITEGKHSAEIERLRMQLAQAQATIDAGEERIRTISLAELTKQGHVYVISNRGSFGSDVFKVGMTRRLDPYDRVLELGHASVPFPFDVHMMIRSENAPALEFELHKALHKLRVNKANPRKEFFRTTIQDIADIVKRHCGEITYTADAEALEYNQSLNMNDADAEYIEQVFEEAAEATESPLSQE